MINYIMWRPTAQSTKEYLKQINIWNESIEEEKKERVIEEEI